MKSLFLAVLLLFPTSASALVIEEGRSADEVAAAMKAAGYPETGLAITAGVGKRALMWSVDQGFLIVGYSVETGVVSGVSFWISDGRPRSEEKIWTYSVKRFETTTGEMVIATKKPK